MKIRSEGLPWKAAKNCVVSICNNICHHISFRRFRRCPCRGQLGKKANQAATTATALESSCLVIETLLFMISPENEKMKDPRRLQRLGE